MVNLLNDLSNEQSEFTTKKCEVKQQKLNTAKIILLTLKQETSNQGFVIVVMHIFLRQVT